MKNTIRLDSSTGIIEADVYVQATCDVRCGCGNMMSIQLNLPDGLVVNASIKIRDVFCSACGKPVVLPEARYWVEKFRLISQR